jgi:SNF2 family DNA or RNA helicase
MAANRPQTLQEYFTSAGVKHPIAFAQHIDVILPELKEGVASKPMKHQKSGLTLCLANDRYALYDDPGTGKSLQSYAYILYWLSEGQKTVAVMPPVLLDQYVEEFFSTMRGADKYADALILNQSPAKRKELYKQWEKEGDCPTLLCMSYQMFSKEHEQVKKLGYRVMVCDEAHALKTTTIDTYKRVEKFINQKGGTSFLAMSGTPDPNELHDFYGLTRLTNPTAYPSMRGWDLTHSLWKRIILKEPITSRRGKMIRSIKIRDGYKRTDLLRENVYKNARRVLRSSVGEIKEPTVKEIAVKLHPSHRALYKKLMRERILELPDGEIITALNEQSLRQKALQIATCPDLFVGEKLTFPNHILQAVDTIIEGVNLKATKIILFCNFRASVELVAERFSKYNPAVIYGGSNSKKNKEKFLNDDTCRMLVANPISAGVGLNLQFQSHTVVFVEPTGVPGTFKQASERVIRHGQEKEVTIYILKALGTIAGKATKQMRRKSGQSQEVHRDKTTLLDHFISA